MASRRGERRRAVVRRMERMETLEKAARAWASRSAGLDCVIVQPRRRPVRAKTLLGLQMACTRAGSTPRVAQSRDRIETKRSSGGRSGVWKVMGPKTSSEMRWRLCVWQNLRHASSCGREKQRPSGL